MKKPKKNDTVSLAFSYSVQGAVQQGQAMFYRTGWIMGYRAGRKSK
jgi:hypothetical protein